MTRVVALRRLARCWDHLRIPLNAAERAERPGEIPYWGANSVQGWVDQPLVTDEVVLLGEDGAPFFDRDRPVAFHVNSPMWPNNHIHVLKPLEHVDARWLAYALNDVDYSLYVGGSTRDKLTQGAMLSIMLRTPALDEQRAIADYLDSETAQIDTLIAKQKQLIANLRERGASLIESQFGGSVGRISTTLRRVLKRQSRASDLDLGVITAYRDGEVTLRSNRREDGYTLSDSMAGYQGVESGDLVFHALDGFAGAVGVSNSPGICSPVYHVCRAKSGFSEKYLALLIRFLGRSGFLAQQAPNVRERSIDFRNWATFARVPIFAHPQRQQKAIVELIRTSTAQTDELIAKARRFIDLSRERRSALITAAVTGQIDVSGKV